MGRVRSIHAPAVIEFCLFVERRASNYEGTSIFRERVPERATAGKSDGRKERVPERASARKSDGRNAVPTPL